MSLSSQMHPTVLGVLVVWLLVGACVEKQEPAPVTTVGTSSPSLTAPPPGFDGGADADAGVDPADAGARTPRECDDAVSKLVGSTPKGHKMLHGPTNPARGHSSNGMRISVGAWPIYDVAVHETHTDHLATLGWFTVDVSKPSVLYAFGPTDDFERLDPVLAAAVKKACAR